MCVCVYVRALCLSLCVCRLIRSDQTFLLIGKPAAAAAAAVALLEEYKGNVGMENPEGSSL